MRNGIGASAGLLVGMLIVAACAGPARAPAPTSVPAAEVPARETAVAPTAAAPPTDTVKLPSATSVVTEPPAAAVNPTAIAELTAVAALTITPELDPGFHRTDDGYYVRGRLDAPVVIEDFSDFL